MKTRNFFQEYHYNEELWYINSSPKNSILNIELTGITYADSTYRIRRSNQWDMYIIEYVLKGKGYIQCNNQKYEVHAGDAYIIRNYTSHEYYADAESPYEKLWINVSGALIDHLLTVFNLTDSVTVRTAGDLSPLFLELKQQLSQEYRMEDIAAILLKLIVQISNDTGEHPDKKISLAEKMRNYMDKNIGKMITTASVADFFHISPIYASRIYKVQYGETINQYINRSTLLLAAQWLRTSDYSIGEISDLLGYCNDNYFSNLFKKQFGMSPKQYQLQHRQKKDCNTPPTVPDTEP